MVLKYFISNLDSLSFPSSLKGRSRNYEISSPKSLMKFHMKFPSRDIISYAAVHNLLDHQHSPAMRGRN